jgi:hypothetical protein
MANEVVERTAGRLRLLFGKDIEKVKRAVNMANCTDSPVEIVNADNQLIGYIVSKQYIKNLKGGDKQ